MKSFSPQFFILIILESEEKGEKVLTTNNISIYLSKFTTLKKLSQLVLCWSLCCSKDLSYLLPPSSFALSNSNVSSISSDNEFVICTYKFLPFLLGSTRCSLSTKVKGGDASIFLSLFSLLLPFLVIPVSSVDKLIPSLGGFLVVFCLYASNLITLFWFLFIACVPYWDSWK